MDTAPATAAPVPAPTTVIEMTKQLQTQLNNISSVEKELKALRAKLVPLKKRLQAEGKPKKKPAAAAASANALSKQLANLLKVKPVKTKKSEPAKKKKKAEGAPPSVKTALKNLKVAMVAESKKKKSK